MYVPALSPEYTPEIEFVCRVLGNLSLHRGNGKSPCFDSIRQIGLAQQTDTLSRAQLLFFIESHEKVPSIPDVISYVCGG